MTTYRTARKEKRLLGERRREHKKQKGLPPDVEALLQAWEPTIRWHARKHAPFAGNGLTTEDLVQAAILVFLAALERKWVKEESCHKAKWDQSHPGAKAWMRRTINTAMVDVLRSQQNAVQFPRHVLALRADVANTDGRLTQELRREPTVVELAEMLDKDPVTIAEMRLKTTAPKSLDETRPDSGDLALELADAGSWEMADRIALRLERQQHVTRILDGLPRTTANVVRLKWGLDANGYELDNKDIAKQLGKSTEWVRLRLREAERHIRHVGLDRTRRRDIKLTPKDIEALIPTKDLAWYNLAGADLTGADLAGADLTGSQLAGTRFDRADLSGADLREAWLTVTSFQGANLSEACLSEIDLCDADFSDADLSQANMSGVNLTQAVLNKANLTKTNLREARLIGWHLATATVVETDFREAKLTGDLHGVDLAGMNLSQVDLAGADLTGANLSDTNLAGANLRWAKLRDTDLSGANLNGADLSGTNLSLTNLAKADLRRAGLNTTRLIGANLAGADLRGTDLSLANIGRADLHEAKLR